MDEGDYSLAFGENAPPNDPHMTFAKMIVHRLLMKAAAGNDKSIQEVLDRLLGRPKQTQKDTQKATSYLTFLDECAVLDEEEGIAPPEPPALIPIPEKDQDDFLREAGLL